jgi:Zn-dependent protease with chaperone function
MSYSRCFLALASCLAFFTSSISLARGDGPAKEDVELVNRVWARLLASAERIKNPEISWPPTCTINNSNTINAYATIVVETKEAPAAAGANKSDKEPKLEFKIQPKVVIMRGMLEQVIHTKADKDMEAAADRLAYVLGHEMCHLLLGHCIPEQRGQKPTPLERNVFGREKEVAADVHGAELALKAGFSLRRGMDAIKRMQKLGLDYSSFEGLLADHPSWNDRLTHLDREQAVLWRAMSAFENGSFFLMTEQFSSAEVCFRQVTREFPKCYEAWSNLGYALLMQYCDGLDAADLRRFKIGQLYIGGFYRRPKSLEAETRGIQSKVWDEAVAAFQKSLGLKKDQVLTKANLGVAYLVHADGNPDLAKACKYLHEAAAMAKNDDQLDQSTRAGILINAGVADLSARRVKEGMEEIDLGEKFGSQFFAGIFKTGVNPDLKNVLLYNKATVAAAAPEKTQQQEGLRQFEQYLQSPNGAGAWWPLAYERYAELAKKLGVEPKKAKEFSKPSWIPHRLVTSVTLGSGATLTLSEPITEAATRLGEKTPVFSRSKLSRIRYPGHGIEVLATDSILAIHLVGEKAPAIPVHEGGIGGKTQPVRLNMPEKEFLQIVGAEPFDVRPLDDPKVLYRFYPYLGLAVRIEKDQVVDLAVTQIPRKRLLVDD